MNTIEQILRQQTEGLREMFVQKIKTYAEKELANAITVHSRTIEEWCKMFGVEPKLDTERMSFNAYLVEQGKAEPKGNIYKFPDSFYEQKLIKNTYRGYTQTMMVYVNENYIKYNELWSKTRETYTQRENYVENAVKKAEQHYENSIKKVVCRLIQKGFTNENMTVMSATLSVHTGFEMTLKNTENGQYVKCFTIIAEGPVQRPHYRFLVK